MAEYNYVIYERCFDKGGNEWRKVVWKDVLTKEGMNGGRLSGKMF